MDSIDRAQISNIADMIEFIETVEKKEMSKWQKCIIDWIDQNGWNQCSKSKQQTDNNCKTLQNG